MQDAHSPREFRAEYIGVIRTPFQELAGMPIQPGGAAEVEGTVLIDERFAAGLKDLDGFSHIYLLYHFHQAARTELEVVPFLDNEKRGVFATRSPLRPAHLGLSVVELVRVEGHRLTVRGIDVLDGTPLIDIKPYVPQFDQRPGARSGWVGADEKAVGEKRSDERFV